MKKQLVNNSTQDTIVLEKGTFGRTYLVIHAINNTNNTENDPTAIELKNIRFNLELTQAGKTISSAFNAVGPAALSVLQGQNVSPAAYSFASDGTSCAGVQTRAAGVANGQETTLVIPITLTPYQLKGDDKLCIDIDLINGHFENTVDTNSKIYFYTEDQVNTNSFDMVLPHYLPIQDDKQDNSFTLPMCSQIALLDTVQSTYNSEALSVPRFAIDSKFYDDKFEEHKYVAMNMLKYGHSNGLTTGNNFMLLDTYPTTIDGVKIDMSIETSNVTSGAQFVYYLGHSANTTVAKRGVKRNAKVITRKLSARGVNA